MRRPGTSARSTRFSGALRRRRYWAAAIVVATIAATFAIASRTEPAYRAAATLQLEGRTLPADAGDDLSQYAAAHLQARYGRAMSAAGAPNRAALSVDQIVVGGGAPSTPRSLSIGFDVGVDGADLRAVERAAQAVLAAMQEEDLRSAAEPAVRAERLEAAALEVDAAADALRTLEIELDGFERSNVAGLPGLRERAAEASRQTERERAALELDRGLRDMQGGAANFRPGAGPLTSETLAALQARWAAIRGRFGADHPDATALGAEITAAQAAAERLLNAANAEFGQAREELARLERLYPIDHPDVVRLAHRVSALESQIEPLRVTGLTNAERAYIEGLARERRDIDPRIAELREQNAALQARTDEQRSQAEQAPVLEQQHRLLQEQVASARARHESANADYQALLKLQETAQNQRPGQLSIVAAPSARRLPMSRPAVVAALGAVAGLLVLVLVVSFVERVDRRIAGAADIARLQGSLPLAEIPSLA